jgi:hypothetical protein
MKGRMARFTTLLVLLSAVVLMAGCGGDVVKQMMASEEMKAKVMDAIAGDAASSGALLDKLMGDEATRTMVMEKVLGNGDMMQGLMGKIATDQTMVDGILNLAVQDSTMKSHLMSVLQGMKMAGAGK